MTKFTSPKKIPDQFIKDRLRQRGSVAGVESHLEHGPLLQINHFPPLSLFGSRSKNGPFLPVKLAGVAINSNGQSWLQSVCVDHRVEFLPLVKHSDHVECLVFLYADKTQRELDVAEALLSLGFARTNNLPLKAVAPKKDKPTTKDAGDKQLEQYYKLLQTVEKSAKRNREGEWNWRLPAQTLPVRLFQRLWKQALFTVLPPSRRLPPLVRD